jgi:palmitoyltransferase
MNPEVKSLLMYRSKTTENLKQFWGRHCDRCNDIKPARTHHCQACNRCVFRMDHHCPWVNNCLGNENLRYFLLFTTYLMLGSLWYALTIVSIWDHHVYIENHESLSF